MHVKICGLTNLDDARAALDAGADLLGFNFYRPSPRYVEPEHARAMLAALRAEATRPAFLGVGVLVNMPLVEALALRATSGLDLLQLHGDEDADYGQALAPQAFKALRPRSSAEAEEATTRFGSPGGERAPMFLIDASHPQLYGGTGATGDWSVAHTLARKFPVLLAGGLTPDNVGDAIVAVRPWGVDVASGVERAPGLKDATKVEAFVRAARRATI